MFTKLMYLLRDKGMTRTTAEHIWPFIGNSVMVRIFYRYPGERASSVLVKCEQFNLTGSIKDRMALYILQKAKESGQLKAGDTIVEATSGNSGIAFAAIGRALGHPVKILMPDWMSRERIDLIRSYGAEIELVSAQQGGFKGSIGMANRMGYDERVFLPRQFENQYNVEAHEKTTGREIGHQLLLAKLKPAAFVAGVGTGGTIMGVGKYLRTLFPEIALHPLEPAESPTLSTGHKVGSHRIQGVSDEFVPEIVDLQRLNDVVQVNDGDAILTAQLLGKIGLGVGISSGANLAGAIKLRQQLDRQGEVITVFPDSNKKYLSTALMAKEPEQPHYISSGLELLRYEQIKS
ncbi:PLP-dependent cysteine synthase family protein [Mucilaginibacter auburnensis]|uniref:Cysteine synthase A n=1 Tax=Mucilaginibacter auburnensis TaxID=1457233 RepID=A0A2H9VR61_9SPHI|nr:PLP-dependent cysteine synthase family protein [Mucilaginibacter auburnensis]PJJ83301.1 cysteine synthase A [Mucilaginibacter auburnensis]